MKKIVSVLLIFALLIVVSACSPKTPTPDTSKPDESKTEPVDTTEKTDPPAGGEKVELDTATITLPQGIELTKNLFDEPIVRVPDVFKASFTVYDGTYEEEVESWEGSTKDNKEFVKKEITVDGQPATILAYISSTGTDVTVFVKQKDGKPFTILLYEDDYTKPTKPADMIELDLFKGLLEGIKLK